jgi:hypothetical protein
MQGPSIDVLLARATQYREMARTEKVEPVASGLLRLAARLEDFVRQQEKQKDGS